MLPLIAQQPIFVNRPPQPERADSAGRGFGLGTTLTACALVFGLVVHGGTQRSEARLQAVAAAPEAARLSKTVEIASITDTARLDTIPAYRRAEPIHGPTYADKARAIRALGRSPFWIEPAYPEPSDPPLLSAALEAGRAPTEAAAEDELTCLALNIYFEALSEPVVGQRAVAHVVMNRVADLRFPATACQVIRQGGERVRHRCQFSWWCDGRSDRPKNRKLWQATKALAQDVYWGRSKDPTSGALWYHADYVNPYWGQVFKKGPKIGRHIFYVADHDNKGIQIASHRQGE